MFCDIAMARPVLFIASFLKSDYTKTMNEMKEKPTIAFVGDSITEGWGLDDWTRERFTTFVQAAFPQYDILNFGSSGATLQSQFDMGYTHTLAFQASQKANRQHPFALLFVFLGANDVWQWTSEATFTSEYLALLARYPDTPKVLVTPIPMNAGPYEHHKIEQIRRLITQIGEKEHIPVLDLTTLSMKDGLSFDGVHPNVNGQKKIAEAIINYLNAHPIQ